jgi:hypothetical protein
MMNDIIQAFLAQTPQQVQVDEMQPMMGSNYERAQAPQFNLGNRAREAAQQAEMLAAMQQQGEGGGGGGGFFSKLFG